MRVISVVKWGALASAWLPFTAKSAVLEATFGSATDIPVAAVQYQASGNEIALSLGFPPRPGVRLTVVNVTGLEPIIGGFSNLGHGQTVVLNHGGNSYPFVANYFGGDGNDLVLHWADTEVYSWGSNGYGQLGVPLFQANEKTDVRAAPVAIAPPVSALRQRFPVSIACGSSHTLALCSDGAVIGWGGGQYGKLGNGATSGLYQSTEVVRTGALAGKTVKAIAAGENFSLALCADGTLAAWGLNNRGQLAQDPGSRTSSAVPLLIPRTGVLAGRQVVSIAAGGDLALAVCGDGSVVS